MDYRGQFQQYQQQFEDYTSNREVVAAAACGLGGLLIITLSLIGGAGGVEWLQRSGYAWGTFIVFLLVTPLGFAIWKGYTYAAHVAAGLIALDLLIDIIVGYARFSVFPNWLIILKFIVLGLIAQVIFEFDEDDEEPPQHYQGGQGGGYPPQQGGGYPPQQGGGWQ